MVTYNKNRVIRCWDIVFANTVCLINAPCFGILLFMRFKMCQSSAVQRWIDLGECASVVRLSEHLFSFQFLVSVGELDDPSANLWSLPSPINLSWSELQLIESEASSKVCHHCVMIIRWRWLPCSIYHCDAKERLLSRVQSLLQPGSRISRKPFLYVVHFWMPRHF